MTRPKFYVESDNAEMVANLMHLNCSFANESQEMLSTWLDHLSQARWLINVSFW